MVFFQNRLCTFIRQSQLSTVIIYFSHRLYLLGASQNRAYSWACPASALLSQAKFFQNSRQSVWTIDVIEHLIRLRIGIILQMNLLWLISPTNRHCEKVWEHHKRTNKQRSEKNDMNKLMIRQCAVCSDGKIIQLKPQIPSLISSGEWQ